MEAFHEVMEIMCCAKLSNRPLQALLESSREGRATITESPNNLDADFIGGFSPASQTIVRGSVA